MQNTSRRTFQRRLGAVLLSATLPLAAAPALAESYPSKPIRLVVPFPPGGPTDTAARIIGQKMSETLKQPVVVDNRPGASGTIGAENVAKSPADGYTLLVLATPTLLAPHLINRKGYDIFKDFTPIGAAYDLPIVMVVNPQAMPDVNSLQQYIAKAKAKPGALNYTSAGNGSFGHLSTELLKNLGNFDVQHVPYKGSAPAISDLLAGQVPMMFSDMIAALPHIKAGKLRPIAVGSGKRVSFTPEVKTVAEQGFAGFDATAWGGLLAPAGTPREVVATLSAELKKALADPTVQQKMLGAGTVAAYMPPEQLAARMKADYSKWGKVIQDNGIRGD
ncbi:Bug family tripartite tricarboxylate transporter substrate binding protein [Cupriavidus alkaliphilus]|uniref:Bug family tripartite tricarboxylate transporter substrate binding protein n=1 Tax=Cupriavidus alkaliphilus TaxID=942866 RepID=UPI000DC2A3F6|nr:tripartite tricarboxylate transporter substrate binding protein [Cupriavidus alkaliphilus]MBB2916260.1 tripartite-type tricarboxylate transporter receptor subunit TctC [Cupriavidus alkaliphilus]MBB3012087.1 tripartite-type tricarboxylate transporter receptor subunit TctC [Cupriavidus alkaliphilus]RAS10366.1 tripartite-type tricarboxylate transporter receptor subunit TctC [Cupriavidus alkaliphilus]